MKVCYVSDKLFCKDQKGLIFNNLNLSKIIVFLGHWVNGNYLFRLKRD
jgi:hypothetical protein